MQGTAAVVQVVTSKLEVGIEGEVLEKVALGLHGDRTHQSSHLVSPVPPRRPCLASPAPRHRCPLQAPRQRGRGCGRRSWRCCRKPSRRSPPHPPCRPPWRGLGEVDGAVDAGEHILELLDFEAKGEHGNLGHTHQSDDERQTNAGGRASVGGWAPLESTTLLCTCKQHSRRQTA
jgi:hypothetical protein